MFPVTERICARVAVIFPEKYFEEKESDKVSIQDIAGCCARAAHTSGMSIR